MKTVAKQNEQGTKMAVGNMKLLMASRIVTMPRSGISMTKRGAAMPIGRISDTQAMLATSASARAFCAAGASDPEIGRLVRVA
jgi:hypothetical protein